MCLLRKLLGVCIRILTELPITTNFNSIDLHQNNKLFKCLKFMLNICIEHNKMNDYNLR